MSYNKEKKRTYGKTLQQTFKKETDSRGAKSE